MSQKICSKCYKRIDDSEIICPFCGKAYEKQKEIIQPVDTKPKKKWLWKVIGLSFALGTAILIFVSALTYIRVSNDDAWRAEAYLQVDMGNPQVARSIVKWASPDVREDVETYIEEMEESREIMGKLAGQWESDDGLFRLRLGELSAEGNLYIDMTMRQSEFMVHAYRMMIKFTDRDDKSFDFIDYSYDGETLTLWQYIPGGKTETLFRRVQ